MSLFRTALLIFFRLIFIHYSYGQNSNPIDSLNKVIRSATSEEVKASAYIELGKAYFQIDFKKSIECCDKAIELGIKNKSLKIIADGYSKKGFALINMGENTKALSCLDSAMKFGEQAGNKKTIASVLANYGNLYYAIGDYPKSLEYHLLCLKKREELNDTVGQGQIYNGIGNIYLTQNNYEKALMWYRKCLDINRTSKNSVVEGIALSNIGTVLIRLNKLDEAFTTYAEALSLAKATNNKDLEATAYMGISKISMRKGKSNEALVNIKKAETVISETGNAYRLNEIHGKMGDVYASMENYTKAIEYYYSYYTAAKQMGMKESECNSLQLISDCYAELNNKEKAYEYLAAYTKMSDSLQNEEKEKQLAELQTKFETERKEKENEILSGKLKVQELELSTNRKLMLGIVILFLLSIIITWLVIRQKQLKFEHIAIRMEQKVLRSQMNPHFIFNSLTTIESFVYENQPKEAGKYLSDFARLMRLILENSAEEYIPLNKEIKTLEYYLVLQKLRLDDNLTYSITTEGFESIDDLTIPPMLTQPFIENSIEHGFRGSSKAARIDIEFKNINNTKLQIQVTDNGKGISNALAEKSENTEQHRSMAMQITKERLLVLNKSKKQKVTFAISDISDSNNMTTGTMVLFTIPLV